MSKCEFVYEILLEFITMVNSHIEYCKKNNIPLEYKNIDEKIREIVS